MRFCFASILALSVSPLVMCSTCDMLGSFDRSHSQVISRSGRPKTFRKYESVSESASCRARVPAGRPLNVRGRLGHL